MTQKQIDEIVETNKQISRVKEMLEGLKTDKGPFYLTGRGVPLYQNIPTYSPCCYDGEYLFGVRFEKKSIEYEAIINSLTNLLISLQKQLNDIIILEK